jgi:6-phosphogluconolactonase
MGEVLYYSHELWAKSVAKLLVDKIEKIIKNKTCNLMLTGGNSAKLVYSELCKLSKFDKQKRFINFYFTDERCVDKNDIQSNYGLVVQELFGNDTRFLNIIRIEADNKIILNAIMEYERALPENIDILLLSVGDDGHIASLFPGSPLLLNGSQKVGHAKSAHHKFDRITILPRVIENSKNILLLCNGAPKIFYLNQFLSKNDGCKNLPFYLAANGTWLVSR